MTHRLYYNDSFLYDFDAEVREVLETPRPALILDRTAFYPTSGGQVFDTGWITSDANAKLRVTEVADSPKMASDPLSRSATIDLKPGTRIRGQIDAASPPRPHAAAFRPARPLRRFRPPLQHADSFVPHGG